MIGPAATPEGERPPVAPVVFLGFVVLVWGGNYPLVKVALADGGAWTFNALRYGLAVMVLGTALALTCGWRRILPEPGERRALALIGILQVAAMTGGTALAMELIEASRTVLIAYSMPFWGLILGAAILGERVTVLALAGLVTGMAGLVLLAAPWAMDWTDRGALIGSGLALGATMCWALGAVLYRRRVWLSGFWQQIFGQLSVTCVVLIAAALLFETRQTAATPSYVGVVLWNAVVPTVLGFWCWARALQVVPVSRAGQVLMLSPVVGVFLSTLLVGEPLTLTILASTGLIVAGALLAYPRRAVAPQ